MRSRKAVGRNRRPGRSRPPEDFVAAQRIRLWRGSLPARRGHSDRGGNRKRDAMRPFHAFPPTGTYHLRSWEASVF